MEKNTRTWRVIKKDDQCRLLNVRIISQNTIFCNKKAPLGIFLMGRMTGLEPATFGTTNQRSNQLSYIRHTGGADQTRTDDPLHAMQVLYQLSYNPMQDSILYLINKKVKLN